MTDDLFDTTAHGVAEEVIIPKSALYCYCCGGRLVMTGVQKLCSPPLDVVFCEQCDLQFWRRTC